MDINQSLKTLGLDERETMIYTFLLKQAKNASLTAFNIAKNVQMPRSTVYLTLQGLENKRLVSSYKKNNVLHYLPADPIRLSKDLDEKKDLLSNLLPMLQGLSKDNSTSSSVKTYTGAKGVRTVFDEIYNPSNLKVTREFHSISHPRLLKYIPKQLPKYMELKKKYNIHTKMLTIDDGTKDYQPDSHRETRLMPPSFSFEGSFIIFGKRTALFSYTDNEVYSIIIDSPAITEMLDSIFVCLWDLLAKK
jgi:sugar-specific transcriptional regulator TrmB